MGQDGGGEKPRNTVPDLAAARRAKEVRDQDTARQHEDRVQDFVNSARNLIKVLEFLKLDTDLIPSDEESKRARNKALEMKRTQLEGVLESQKATVDATGLSSEEIADIEAAAAEYIKRFGKA